MEQLDPDPFLELMARNGLPWRVIENPMPSLRRASVMVESPKLPVAASFKHFDPTRVPSPCFVVDEDVVEANLRVLHDIEERSGARVLLALKAFSMFSLAPLVNYYLSGTCASGLYEARLGHEEFGGEVGQELHTFSPAYKKSELEEILAISNHVVFNSLSQWERFRGLAKAFQSQRPELRFGLRINPAHSEAATPLYDPCAPGSRLGIRRENFGDQLPEGISGLHFHTLCEQDFAPLARTVAAVEEQFGDILPQLEWVNFGGGHHITRADYDREALIALLRDFSEKYGVQVYLEPGEAAVLNAGVLVSEVLDIQHSDRDIAVLDTSATCHMPDTLEMPYRAHVFGSAESGVKPHSYRLGGLSCLAGDVMGDYSFDEPLRVGQRLMFDDMAHYTMVKTTTFNGVPLPSLATWNAKTDKLRLVKRFHYEDFKGRLS